MKKTAVEWYIDALKQWDLCYMESNGKISKDIYESTKISLQEQAKAMEKEQIVNGVIYGNKLEFYDGTEIEIADQYFNKTYKSI